MTTSQATGRHRRRDFLSRLFAGTLGIGIFRPASLLRAADVNWLAEVRQPPRNVPKADTGHFEPLLIDDSGKMIRTRDEWIAHRELLRKRWLKFLGPMPDLRPQVNLEILKEDRPAGCIRQLVRYESEPGIPVEGYLLRPTSPLPKSGKRSAVVALHQTSKNSIAEVAGLKGPAIQQIGLKLCRSGFVVFCPRCFLWQNASNYLEAVERFRRRHPGALGMHKMLYDAQRGVDVLASLPDVDSRRIGTAGHSLGGKTALYLAAFDERIKAAVASDGGIGFRYTNWDAPWYLGPGIQDPKFRLNHHQLLALIAPRPFLVIGGEQKGPSAADGDRTWPFIAAALPVYRLYGKPARIGLYNHRQGHTLPPQAFARMQEWLKAYLEDG